jgi:hypothetical protein
MHRSWSPAALYLLVALAFAGCATTDQDVHLAPLFSNLATAGGGREIEGIFGALRIRRPDPKAPVNEWALRPLMSQKLYAGGDTRAWFLVPLGTDNHRGTEHIFQLLPLIRYQTDIDEQGQPEWRLLMLPGILWSQDNSGKRRRAVFPFGGVTEHWITFDKIVFWLFPIYLRTERAGQISTSFLWPFFNYTYGPRGTSFRFFPLVGRSHIEGSHDRWFFLWPIFHWHKNHVAKPEPEDSWMIWPLIGHKSRGSFRAWSFLWPFFGYSYDKESGFWAWDGLWPAIRFLRPGKDDPKAPYRTRLWPLYSYYKGDNLESTWVLWPFANSRVDSDRFGVRRSLYFVPIWQNWERTSPTGVKSSWKKFWPLWQASLDEDGHARFAFPALSPLWNLPLIDDHYAWLYELLTRDTYNVEGKLRVKERSWGGFWRRETDENEDRASLVGVWAQRRYAHDGEELVEHSMFFGLLRWRSHPTRRGDWPELMKPAFPGPGWPAQREARPPGSAVPAWAVLPPERGP